MGSIVRYIDDIVEEYGSWENYLKADKISRERINIRSSGGIKVAPQLASEVKEKQKSIVKCVNNL